MRPYKFPDSGMKFPAILSSVIRQSCMKNRLYYFAMNSQDTLKELDLVHGYIKRVGFVVACPCW